VLVYSVTVGEPSVWGQDHTGAGGLPEDKGKSQSNLPVLPRSRHVILLPCAPSGAESRSFSESKP
jgi:hypothetical protein